MMDFEVIENEKDLLAAVRNQLFHEINHQVPIHGLLEEGKTHQPLIADRRDHRQTLALG